MIRDVTETRDGWVVIEFEGGLSVNVGPMEDAPDRVELVVNHTTADHNITLSLNPNGSDLHLYEDRIGPLASSLRERFEKDHVKSLTKIR